MNIRHHLPALVVSALALAFPPATDAQLRDVQETTLTAGDGTSFLITSAVVRVPELRSEPGPATSSIDLAVVRVRRAGSTSSKAHIVLAGGPGDSGVNVALGMARQGGANLADIVNGDIIGIDQRGTGKSTPNLSSSARYDLPLDRPGSPEVWLPIIEATTRRVAAEFRNRGIRLEAYNTEESADDVDDVRRALGYDTVTLWGRSYGSHLALAVLKRHPSIVERLVLIGPEGPNHTWKLPAQTDVVIDRIGTRAGIPDLGAKMKGLIERLTREPIVVSVTNPRSNQPATMAIGGFDLQWLTAQALGDPRMVATLPAAYRLMAAGDFTNIAQLLLIRRTQYGVESAMKHLMDVSSGVTADRRARIEHEAATALLGNAMNFPGFSLQKPWGARDLGDGYRAAVTSPVPALILVGDLDTRTPVENGIEIASTMPNSRLVVVEHAAHQFDVFGSAPIRSLLVHFLTTGRVDQTHIALPPIAFRP
jgi:pimeloyl-ACP methyl ester carboxylesterase